jgi:hypothetical protein
LNLTKRGNRLLRGGEISGIDRTDKPIERLPKIVLAAWRLSRAGRVSGNR